VLLRWMLAAVKPQKHKSSPSARKYAENNPFQHDIPVCSRYPTPCGYKADSYSDIDYGYLLSTRCQSPHFIRLHG
jgi:hypothetical protein